MIHTAHVTRLLAGMALFMSLTGFKPEGDYPAIVVGSGFGGSIAAYHLGNQGVPTLVLERGRWWTVEDPTVDETFATLETVLAGDGKTAWLSDTCRGNFYFTFLPEGSFPCSVTTGMLEIIQSEPNPYDRSPAMRTEGMAVSAAAGVGGGSLLYNGVSYVPLKQAWDVAFPEEELPYMQAVWYQLQEQGYFDHVMNVIAPSPPPADVLATPHYEGTRLMRHFAVNSGYPLEDGTDGPRFHGSVVVPTATDWDAVRDEIAGLRTPSVILGEAWWGNNSDAKHSLDKPDNFLGMALATGNVDVRALHTVNAITYDEDTELYTVEVSRTDLDYNELEVLYFTTPNLIMSAGSMGTTKLMVRARAVGDLPELNDHVGTRWSSNGNTTAFRFVKNGVVGQGGPAGMKVVNYDDPDNPIVFENLPQRVPSFFADIPELAPFLGALLNIGLGIPEDYGTWRYEADTDTVVMNWPTGAATNVYAGFISMMNDIVGGTPFLLPQSSAQAFTAHPLGGMPLGLATDLYCEVKGYKNLYAVDGSIVPGAAAATNPSILIAAMADRCMDKIAKDITNKL